MKNSYYVGFEDESDSKAPAWRRDFLNPAL